MSSSLYQPLPPPPKLSKLIGPSFIILALGLGSGEVILWPYLVSNYGLGIAWGAIIGITFQFFINMEIERYALLKGESVFVGINKIWRGAAYWFIFSTFIGFGLPGIIAASAKVAASVLGVGGFQYIAVGFLILIGLILSSGQTVYGMMEKITKTILLIGVPFIFILTLFLSDGSDWLALFNGLIGRGDGFSFLPAGISLAAFFAAFAYSGAGGNLNLTQSIYVKEKGYGMGKYSERIAGLFKSGATQKIKLSGISCEATPENVATFKSWWRLINREHLLVFWFIGLLCMSLLMLLAYTTAYGLSGNAEGINFVISEGAMIGGRVGGALGVAFLVAVVVMLFQTQLGVMDSTSRIMAENAAIKKLGNDVEGQINLSKIYYIFLWMQIVFGCVLLLGGLHEPKTLIVLGAVLNAVAMFVHTGLIFWLNQTQLAKSFRPAVWRQVIIILIFVFFGFFSSLVLADKMGWLKKIEAPVVAPVSVPVTANALHEFKSDKGEIIKLENFQTGQNITSPLTISGSARGTWFFEGSFPVILVDWDGKIIAESFATAQGEWMTEDFVPFTATIEFAIPNEPYNRGALILKKDNPSGLPEHDDAVEIWINFN
ncbi:MAG: hypothetical protein A2538_00375 [Candidatus Magasanikbacteria bacterium RIFOXYD2_FULL_41_14]|uniref:Bacterial spore germination immunoglobulin-like domain-containing protein n=1 Tax=Candidatus Magasanikbacteria bacterium RIFOXYD2_FULL_41_14 TaxID=1798709 RepID=A0A1F6PEP7_9BACT|nr:MAG: hypothetical protein A2538_00375 [Candidatus Magasanikbacteria bacterium RIFOXYD2_FULL_41_14]